MKTTTTPVRRLQLAAAALLVGAGAAACGAANPHAAQQPAELAPAGSVEPLRPLPEFDVTQYWPGTEHWPPPEPLGPQYWPGTEHWPPPEPLGPQYWPGTEHWPPPQPLGPQYWPTAGPAEPAALESTQRDATDTEPDLTEEEIIDAVVAAVGTVEAAFEAALRNPDDPSLRQPIVDATVDESQAQHEFVGSYDNYMAEGQWAEAHPDGIENSVAILEEPRVLADGAVWVLVCHVGGDQLMGLDESGAPALLDGTRNARVVGQVFVSDEGEYKLETREVLGLIPEATSCEPETLPSSSAPA